MSLDGTIDITESVEIIRQGWVEYMIRMINGLEAATPELAWLNAPIINGIEEAIIREILNTISKDVVQMAFFLNTALKKPSQAKDFTTAVANLRKLPEDVTHEEYALAEEAKVAAFRSFVAATS